MPYMPLVIAFAQKYEPKTGLGTILALMLPYSVAFALSWTVLLAAWLLIGLPLGPGAALTYPAPSG
jgi:aminobenzoyl-glutamate transport protein